MKSVSQFFSNLRIKHKLFYSYLIVIIIPLSVLGWYSYDQSKKLLNQQAELGVSRTAVEFADKTNYKFKKYGASIESISFNSSIKEIFNNNYTDYYYLYYDIKTIVDPLLNINLFLNEEINQLTIFTENNITERKKTISPISHIEEEPWFSLAMNGQTNWFGDGDKIFGVQSIIGDQAYSLKNMVYLELDTKKVFKESANILLDEYGLVLYDERGQSIYSYESSDEVTGSLPWEEDSDYLPAHAEEELVARNFIVNKQQLPDTNWTLMFYVPRQAIGIDAKKIVQATVLIVGICLLVLLMIIWIFSTSFIKRIHGLNQKMKQVARGELNVDISVDSTDEIGELTGRFRNMLQSLNELFQEVHRSKDIQKDAELRALQAQINPHFLYNTLSIINWKAIKIDAKDISKITTTLSKFYRTTLNNGEDVISVFDELQNVISYVEIQLIMHDHSFDFICEVDEEIMEMDMIKLILQPIVENAIEHGIDNKVDGRGKVGITGNIVGNDVEFVIADNGPGMMKELIRSVLGKRSKSYGLYNVQERIRIYFGEQYGLTIQSNIGEGTTVIIRMPRTQRKQS